MLTLDLRQKCCPKNMLSEKYTKLMLRCSNRYRKGSLRNYLASSTCRTKTDYFSSILTPSSFGGLKVTLLQCIKLFMVLMTLLVLLNSVLIPVLEVVSWKSLNRIATTMFEHILLPVDMLTVGMNNRKLQCVSKKNIPDIFSCNSRKHCRIFIMFGTHVTEKVSNQ